MVVSVYNDERVVSRGRGGRGIGYGIAGRKTYVINMNHQYFLSNPNSLFTLAPLWTGTACSLPAAPPRSSSPGSTRRPLLCAARRREIRLVPPAPRPIWSFSSTPAPPASPRTPPPSPRLPSCSTTPQPSPPPSHFSTYIRPSHLPPRSSLPSAPSSRHTCTALLHRVGDATRPEPAPRHAQSPLRRRLPARPPAQTSPSRLTGASPAPTRSHALLPSALPSGRGGGQESARRLLALVGSARRPLPRHRARRAPRPPQLPRPAPSPPPSHLAPQGPPPPRLPPCRVQNPPRHYDTRSRARLRP